MSEPRPYTADTICLLLAALLALFGGLLNNITLASSDYLVPVLTAVATSLLSIVLTALVWRRVGLIPRLFSCGVVLLCLWTLYDAAGRRLPAMLGG